jgi:hypothetical protein
MSTDPTSTGGAQPSEDELRAAYEAELKKLRVEQVLLENVVSLVNLGMRRTGLAPGTEDERDPAQVRVAIEAVRALAPLVEQVAPGQARAVKDAVSQLQLAFVRIGGQAPARGEQGSAAAAPGPPSGAGAEPAEPTGPAPEPSPPSQEPGQPGEPGPAQRSGRLWVPGQ